jgi:hypothetical protein
VTLRLGKGKPLLGRHARGHRRRQRLAWVVGGIPVDRHLRGGLSGSATAESRLGGQTARQGRVQAASLTRQQVGVDHLPQQHMPERVPLGVRVGHEHLLLHCLAHRPKQRRLVEVTGRGEQPMADLPAGHCGDLQHLPRRRG